MKTLLCIFLFTAALRPAWAQLFAPLQIGNTWVFSDVSGYKYKANISDTIEFNGVKYYKVVGQGYCRYESISRLYYNRANPTDYPYYKKSFSLGDTIYFAWNDYRTVYDTIRMNVFGKPTTVKFVHSFNYGGLVEAWEMWTEEYGLLYSENSEGGGYDFSLHGCVINGALYGDTSTVVSVTEELTMPAEYKLYQNYPNPFNPITVIRYEISNKANIKLIVYDIMGQEISRLVDESQSPGRYSKAFDATALSSGIYMYRLFVGDMHETKKMVLLR